MKHRVKNNKQISFSQKVSILAGSNQGDSAQIIEQARKHMEIFSINQRILHSNTYKTEAWGNPNQPPFLNQLWIFRTILPPYALLHKLQNLEHRWGRKRTEHWGPRTLDLDILYYGNLQIYSNRLSIPHPEIPNRRFALVPLVEMLAHYVHPVLGQTQQALLNHTSDTCYVQKCC